MFQIGFKGRVVDETATGLVGYRVEVALRDFLEADRTIASCVTFDPTTGSFNTLLFDYFNGHDLHPTIVIRVFDPVGRTVFESDPDAFVDLPLEMIDIEARRGAIVIPADVRDGFRVTLRGGYFQKDPTGAVVTPSISDDPYPGLTGSNTVKILVDDEQAWKELTEAVLDVKGGDHIHITQLWFDIEHLRSKFPDDESPPQKLGELLVYLARLQNPVKVRICLNDYGLPGIADSVENVKRYLKSVGNPAAIEVSSYFAAPGQQLHAKLVVAGSRAFLLGSPLIQAYYDDTSHNFAYRRRGAANVEDHTTASPLHDVSALVEGPAAQLLDSAFVDLWNVSNVIVPRSTFTRDPFFHFFLNPEANTPPPPPLERPTAPPRDTTVADVVQVVRTLPSGRVPDRPHGERGVLEGYLRAIAKAKDFIYMDNQYFTEPLIANALAAALEKKDSTVEVIIIFNPRVDIPGYQSLEPARLKALISRLKEYEKRNALATGSILKRLGLFSLWSHGPQDLPSEPPDFREDEQKKASNKIIRIYTHAKAAVVDDCWATVGSANLDGASLTRNEVLFTANSAVELNLLFFNDVDGLPKSDAPSNLRRALWAEHLGYVNDRGPNADAEDLVLLLPGTTWLSSLWIPKAKEKLASLIAPDARPSRVRILQWPATPKGMENWWDADDPANNWDSSDLSEQSWLQHLLGRPSPFFTKLGVPKANLEGSVQVETEGPSFLLDENKWK